MSAIHYQLYEGQPSGDVLDCLVHINETIFSSGESAEALNEFLAGRTQILLCLAFEGEAVVGSKLGYKERAHYFESWRGGVLPSARRRGVASALMKQQHVWAKEQGFRIISTITNNQNAPMLILNLRHGFKIVGTFLDREKHLKVIQQKRLFETPQEA